MEPRLWSWPIRWQGTHWLWVITHVQPTNQSMRHPLITSYWKNNLQMIRRGSNWGWSVLAMFVHEFQSLKFLNLEKPTSIPHCILWNIFGKTSWFCVKQNPHKKLEYRVMNIFEAFPRFAGPAEGGSPKYHPLRLGPKIVGKCSLPCKTKISKFETLQKWKVLNQTRIFSVG